MSRVAMLVVALVSWLAFGSPAHAAGFDCSRASATDEKTVCASASLSALDSEMTGLWYAYERIPMMMGASGARADEARDWLDRRRQCGSDGACLERAYVARIAQLKQRVADWMQSMQIVATDGPAAAACSKPE